MAASKLIGIIENVVGSVKIIGLDGSQRLAVIGENIYEGEKIVGEGVDSLFEVKYLALTDTSIYEGVFEVLADASVFAQIDTADAEITDDVLGEIIDDDVLDDTEAGEGEVAANSSYVPNEATANSNVLDIDRGEDGAQGLGIVNTGTPDTTENAPTIDQEAPVITSTNVVVFNENSSETVLTVTSTDTNPVTYSIDSGLDADLFSINPTTGELIFNAEPDYQNPLDLGGDNEYNLNVTVTDSLGNYTTQAISVNINAVPTIDSIDTALQTLDDATFVYDTPTPSGTINTIADSTAINTGTYTEKTIAASFTTSVVDPSDPFQVIYEQGGAWNGYSISIVGENAYAFVWGESYNTINPNYAVIDLGVVESNQTYTVSLVHDANDVNGGSLSAYLNGVQDADIVYGVGEMGSHSGDVGIGGVRNDTVNPVTFNNVNGNGHHFQGTVNEVVSWNSALDANQVSDAVSHLTDATDTTIYIDEGTQVGTELFNVTASDVEDAVTYTLVNDFDGLFAVDANGSITVEDILYLGSETSYSLELVVSDNNAPTKATVSQTFEVNITGDTVGDTSLTNMEKLEASNDLVLKLDMNDTALSDTQGKVNDIASLKNGATTGEGVLNLDGTNDFVQISNSNDINKSVYAQRTVSLWFNADDTTGTQFLFAEGVGTSSLQIYLEDGVLTAKGYNHRSDENDWMNDTVLADTNTLSTNEWHNVTITLTGDATDPLGGLSDTGFKMYLDGNLVDEGVGGALYGHDDAHIGSSYSGKETFAGSIDNVRVFNSELANEEVNILFSEGEPTLEIASSDTFDLSNVADIASFEVIELGTDAKITDTTGNGINIQDVIDITNGDTLIIKDTDDSDQTVNIDTTVFEKTTDGTTAGTGVDIYTDSTTTYTIEIDSTIVVD